MPAPDTPLAPITWADVAAYEAALATEIPGFAVAYKDESRSQRLIARVLSPFNDRYLSDYTTVLFGTVWFPSRAWRVRVGPRGIYETLRHEAVHLRDARRWPLLFHVSYLLLPLPMGVTLRAWWEWRGYRESLLVTWELDGRIDDVHLDWVAQRFTGPDYLFMWPFPRAIRRALGRLRERILAGEVAPDRPLLPHRGGPAH